jgi:hypothetical protein
MNQAPTKSQEDDQMNGRIWLCSGIVILLLFLACGPKSIITPNVDLRKYDRVGLIGFTCNAEGNMEEFVTRWLLMTLRKYQKTARIIELGSEEEVLESVQADTINSEAIRAIGQTYNVSVIFTGNVEVTEIQPLDVPHRHWLFREARPISGKTSIEGKRVKARVKAWITARLWDAEQGGTLWRTSAFGEEVVDHVSGVSDGKIIFDASEPRQAYWDLVNPLVKKICADFETTRARTEKNWR